MLAVLRISGIAIGCANIWNWHVGAWSGCGTPCAALCHVAVILVAEVCVQPERHVVWRAGMRPMRMRPSRMRDLGERRIDVGYS